MSDAGGHGLNGGWITLPAATVIAVGECLELTVDGEPAFLLRTPEGLKGYLNRCPHLGIELNWTPGRFLEPGGHFIQCATHGALFTPDRGHCIAGPCQGDRLTALEVRQPEGRIQVRLRPA